MTLQNYTTDELRAELKRRVTNDSPRWNMFHQPMIDEIIGKEVDNDSQTK